jgi:hypothetical protein
MGQSYAKNKIHIYNSRAKDVAKYNEYVRVYRLKMRCWIKIKKEFLNILLV